LDTSITIDLIVFVISIALSSFFSATETALTSLSSLKVRHILKEKGDEAKSLLLWLNHPEKVLNTILFGNNLVNILASVLATKIMKTLFDSVEIAITTGVMTFIILICGEITPKTFAKNNAQTVAIFNSKILKYIYYLIYPITYIMASIVNVILKITGGRNDNNTKLTEDELEFLIDIGEKEGVLDVTKGAMLASIFDISDINIKEVMIPRIDVKAINENSSKEDLVKLLQTAEYSRIPVYRDSLDNIVGILYLKDIIRFVDSNFNMTDVIKLLKEPLFVPETKKVDTMLKEFQKSRLHLAVVIDEYGGTAGIITMEDILEEIVGDIFDEFDTYTDEVSKIDDNIFLVDARMDIDDFCEEFDIEKTEDMGDYETLGGFIFNIAGEIPSVGDSFDWYGYRFTVKSMQDRKLIKIEFKKLVDDIDLMDIP